MIFSFPIKGKIVFFLRYVYSVLFTAFHNII